MKRVWKKMAALLMMMAMVFGISIIAKAAASTTGAGELTTHTLYTVANVVSNTATVEISGIDTQADAVSFKTYQVIYATYDSTSNELEWHLTDWATTALSSTSYTTDDVIKALAIGSTPSASTTGQSTTEQSEVINVLAAYIAANNTVSTYATLTGDSAAEFTTTSTGTASTTATLAVGAYLVIPTCANMSFLNMLVSVDVDGTTGNTGTTAKDGWVLTSNGAVLKGNLLSVSKTVSDTENGTYGETADAQIGTTVYYQLKVYVPKFAENDSEKIFYVEDTATNLKIDATSVKILAYGWGDELIACNDITASDGTAQYYASTDSTGSKLTVIFSNAKYPYYDRTFYDDSDGSYPYDYVIISYSAELLDEAVVTTGNKNSATMTYDYDNHTSVTTQAVTTAVYTYEVDLTKLAEGTTTTLSNASFEITDSNGNKLNFTKDTSASTDDLPVYRVADTSVASKDKSPVITTGTDGVRIIGLDESVAYTIVETVAPSGYTLNTNTLTFTITDMTSDADASPNGTIDVITLAENQGNTTTLNWSTSNDEKDWPTGRTWSVSLTPSSTGGFGMSVTDTKIAALPATGSVGIIVFTIAGVAIMILALVLINSGKSKQKKA